MTQYRDPPHYLKPLTTTKTPDRLMWLDCSTRTTKELGALVARFQAGALGTTHYTRRRGERSDTIQVYDNPVDLWEAASGFCTKGKRVVLFAHDLAHQIRVSQAMVRLPELGWDLDNIVLERTAAWALYRQDTRSLMMCDLRSWAPVDLGLIGSDVTNGNVKLLDVSAGPDFHLDLCKARALCVRDAVLQILNWIEGENLGPFRPTGSGQSYSAYRRRFTRVPVLVHDDDARLTAERAAMHTGRCEAWQHGKLVGGPFVEYDMRAAYCHIAAECDVPTIANGEVWQPTPKRVQHAMQTHSILAHVTVQTDMPVLPVKVGNRTMWPVGEFTTWVWDSELRLAFDYCDHVKVHRAYRYKRGPALRAFAEYVLDGMAGQTQVYGLVPARVLKHWSRCLVGRLGLRYRRWERIATVDETDLLLATVVDDIDGMTTDMLIAGRDWLLLSEMVESPESVPQIPSWVMSECRARLWRAMMSVGLDAVVYVDTDSIITDQAGAAILIYAHTNYGGPAWTRKGRYTRLTINGPRNLVAEDERRVSGIPLTARQTAPLEFTGQVMRSVKESMRAGEMDRVTVIPRRFSMHTPDLRRQHMPNNQTAPFKVRPSTQEDD